MTTTTQTLTEFLLARLAQDERQARQIHADRCETPAETMPDTMGRAMAPVCDCDWHVARVLADVEAKRRIVEECSGWDNELDEVGVLADRTLRLLALPYADHPDYREEWKP